MPATREGVNITNAYRADLLLMRYQLAAVGSRAWLSLNPAELDTSFALWLQAMEALTEAVKRQGASKTYDYMAAFMAAETLSEAFTLPDLDVAHYVPTIDGRTIKEALLTPIFTVKSALKQGRTPEESLRLGGTRATRILAVESMDAPRRALRDLMLETDEVVSWGRVVSVNACGACLALTTEEERSPDDLIEVHGDCRCTAEPRIRREQRFRRPTGREIFEAESREAQDARFHGRGGAEKAELIRSGDVPFESLIQREPMQVIPDQYTEAPLEVLERMALLKRIAEREAREAPMEDGNLNVADH